MCTLAGVMGFKKILVAVDFSEPSHKALQTAAQISADTGAELVLVHVWRPSSHTYGGLVFPITFAEDYIKDATVKLAGLQHVAEAAGATRVTSEVLTGAPWHEVIEMVRKDQSFDLIIVGSQGLTGVKHVLLGSVAEKIVRHAPCPVLVVRTRE